MRALLLASAVAATSSLVSDDAAAGPGAVGEASSSPLLGGGLRPRVDPETWHVWSPSPSFLDEFASWADEPADEMLVWCKAFIPSTNTSGVVQVNGRPAVPLELPGIHLPLPGYAGQCAAIDGRDWAPDSPYRSGRPTDSRFGAYLQVAGDHVAAQATCGFSHNYCCRKGGCPAAAYGEQTCGPQHCPDSEMRVRRLRCWTEHMAWTPDGVDCSEANGTIVAVKAYVQGRGGDPCVHPLGVPSPKATWDIGVVMFPTKRRVILTGYVDDAPATECYAEVVAKGQTSLAVLAQMPMPTGEFTSKLPGFSDRPLNEAEVVTYVAQKQVEVHV